LKRKGIDLLRLPEVVARKRLSISGRKRAESGVNQIEPAEMGQKWFETGLNLIESAELLGIGLQKYVCTMKNKIAKPRSNFIKNM
jgi:hypothetical protein